MKLKLLFFASIRELTGVKELEVNFEKDKLSVEEVINLIKPFDDQVKKDIFQKISHNRLRIILNGNSISNKEIKNISVKNEDQLAFLPPVGGG
jgi:MoaD family protein